MSRLRLLGFVAAFLLQTALLAWIVGDRALLLARGSEVRLSVVPVDPRDLFRGDYVILSYDISRIREADVTGDRDFVDGSEIYVSLAAEGGTWKAVSIHKAPPGEGTYLAGVVADVTDDTAGCVPSCKAYRVAYGLEQFFVPEGEGKELETLRNDQRISVDVAVGSGGRAALKRLLVDGEVRYEEPTL